MISPFGYPNRRSWARGRRRAGREGARAEHSRPATSMCYAAPRFGILPGVLPWIPPTGGEIGGNSMQKTAFVATVATRTGDDTQPDSMCPGPQRSTCQVRRGVAPWRLSAGESGRLACSPPLRKPQRPRARRPPRPPRRSPPLPPRGAGAQSARRACSPASIRESPEDRSEPAPARPEHTARARSRPRSSRSRRRIREGHRPARRMLPAVSRRIPARSASPGHGEGRPGRGAAYRNRYPRVAAMMCDV